MHHRGHVGNFNPRAPRGARPGAGRRSGASAGFQSTRPSRGATALAPATRAQAKISIHAPLAGRDRGHRQFYLRKDHFNPRAPRGALLWELKQRAEDADFNPRAPRGARLWSTYSFCQRQLHFNPRAPRGARQQMCTKITYIFALTHKRNTFSCQTPSVRALSKKLSGRFSHKIRCEPPCKTMCAAAPHYTISVPSGRYVCLQPKCSILLSYFFPK